jgi:hypothetical protein
MPDSEIFVSMPPALAAEVQTIADQEHRPVADVLRDLVERGLGERRWTLRADQELARARALGLTDEYRQTLREKIAQGAQSLREGRVTDGAVFMARMDDELAELERNDRSWAALPMPSSSSRPTPTSGICAPISPARS